MEYPIFADTPQGADPLGSWPQYSIVGAEPPVAKKGDGGAYAARARKRKRLRLELEREDDEILTVIACMLEADIL